MTNLVVLSYGRESEYRRAILAVLSYHTWLPATDAELGYTVIYTDNPDYLRPYLERFHKRCTYGLLFNV